MTAEAADRLFADRLTAVRNARGLSGSRLAAEIGRHERFVYDIERRHRKVSIGEAVEICAVLGVDAVAMADPAVSLATLTGGAE